MEEAIASFSKGDSSLHRLLREACTGFVERDDRIAFDRIVALPVETRIVIAQPLIDALWITCSSSNLLSCEPTSSPIF